jgi:tetratricopeptide (TPR) repeat protein
VNSDQVLHGAEWFYYAARFGEYLGYRKQARSQDFLPASLEAAPAASNSYVELGDSYRDLKQPARAADSYREALQLSPSRADIYDRLALLAITGGRRADAISDWRRAFEILGDRVEKGPLPPEYWSTAQTVLEHMNEYHAVEELKPDADAMLRTYIKRNGSYDFDPFLAGIFRRPPDPRAALDWVLTLSRLPEMDSIVRQVLQSNWIPESEKDPLYRAEIEHQREELNRAQGEEPRETQANELRERMLSYARYLQAQQRWSDEWGLLNQVEPASGRPAEMLLTAGALSGHLDELLGRYRTQPESAPPSELVLQAASSLTDAGHRDVALQIEDFEYRRELDASSPPASAWFGMARVRLEQKRNEEALLLIRNATLTVGAPFENLPEAVRLLEQYGLKGDAARYALEWRTAEPWNEKAQLEYARLQAEPSILDQIRKSNNASYEIRVAAALQLRDLQHPASGTDELSLLTHATISAAEASQPFFVKARVEAAQKSTNSVEKLRLYREAIQIEPSLSEPRLEVAATALELRRDALGIAALDSYTQQRPIEYDPDEEDRRSPPPLQRQPRSKRYFAVEELAAAALVRMHELGRSLSMYIDLAQHSPDVSRRPEFQKTADAISRQQSLQAINEMRRPVVTNNITQPVIVKPRLRSLPTGGQQ